MNGITSRRIAEVKHPMHIQHMILMWHLHIDRAKSQLGKSRAESRLSWDRQNCSVMPGIVIVNNQIILSSEKRKAFIKAFLFCIF